MGYFRLLHSVLLYVIFALYQTTAEIVSSSSIANATFDYLVAGCGISGLTITTRLTEENFTVLCIEAGQLYVLFHVRFLRPVLLTFIGMVMKQVS